MSDYTQVVTCCLFFIFVFIYILKFFNTFIITEYTFSTRGASIQVLCLQEQLFTVGGSESSSEKCASQTDSGYQTDWPPVVIMVISTDLFCEPIVAVSSIRRKQPQSTAQCEYLRNSVIYIYTILIDDNNEIHVYMYYNRNMSVPYHTARNVYKLLF